ncbi:MAG: VOC family protein [Reichenbachiella sp.]
MKIEHIAIWVNDLEGMKDFYTKYFDLTPNNKYHNPIKHFTSYFLSFPEGARIELMYRPDVVDDLTSNDTTGFVHFALSLGSKSAVDELTEKMRASGVRIVGEPRTTGDGYYESVILDPEGNQIELTE